MDSIYSGLNLVNDRYQTDDSLPFRMTSNVSRADPMHGIHMKTKRTECDRHLVVNSRVRLCQCQALASSVPSMTGNELEPILSNRLLGDLEPVMNF